MYVRLISISEGEIAEDGAYRFWIPLVFYPRHLNSRFLIDMAVFLTVAVYACRTTPIHTAVSQYVCLLVCVLTYVCLPDFIITFLNTELYFS